MKWYSPKQKTPEWLQHILVHTNTPLESCGITSGTYSEELNGTGIVYTKLGWQDNHGYFHNKLNWDQIDAWAPFPEQEILEAQAWK